MPVLFDIDLDFFLDCENTLLEQPDKKIWLEPEEFLSPYGQAANLYPNHCDCLAAWDEAGARGWDCWHFDAHADLGSPGSERLENIVPGVRSDYVNSGNYLFFALREEIISTLNWILPSWLSMQNVLHSLDHLPPHLLDRIHLISYRPDNFPKPDRIDIAFSPDFTPITMLARIGNLLCKQGDKLDNLLDAILKRQSKLIRPEPVRFFRNSPKTKPATLYHGSAITGLKELAGNPLYLTPSPAIAASFGPRTNDDWILGVDDLNSDYPMPYILMPAAGESHLAAPMSIYTTKCADAKFAGAMTGYEITTSQTCLVKEEIYYPSASRALEHYGVYLAQKGAQNLPEAYASLAASSADQLEDWLEMPIDAVLALEPLKNTLIFFFGARNELSADLLATIPFTTWQRLLDRRLLPLCAPFILCNTDWHGIRHARETALWSAILALRNGHSPLPAMLAACLHDCCRVDDEADGKHALNSAETASIFLKHHAGQTLPYPVEVCEEIIDAIKYHPIPKTGATPAACFLLDADRLRLAWAEHPISGMFSTPMGRMLANETPDYAENLKDFLFELGKEPESFECKLEITHKCNLKCHFCHQGFGASAGSHDMTMDVFISWLERLEKENITMLRLTGGEPVLHPEFEHFLAIAKERDFYITVNSNALLLNSSTSCFQYIDCLKISFPAASERSSFDYSRIHGLFEHKLEIAALAAAQGCQVEFLTPVYNEAIAEFESFIEILEDLSFIRWVPLRAEASPKNRHPVTQENMRLLLDKIALVRTREHWSNLKLHLSTPFCICDNPFDAARLLEGRQKCGPMASVAVDPTGHAMRCYSRRGFFELGKSIREQAHQAAMADFFSLPEECRRCPACLPCLGGCRCPSSIDREGFDVLARPPVSAQWRKEKTILKTLLGINPRKSASA